MTQNIPNPYISDPYVDRFMGEALQFCATYPNISFDIFVRTAIKALGEIVAHKSIDDYQYLCELNEEVDMDALEQCYQCCDWD